MTLLSNAFCAAPSTPNDTITVNDRRSVSCSPSTSPSTAATFNEPSPSQVLAMTIKKKRRVLRSKDRNLRVEILLTSTIRRLCQEIGDHLRSRRVASAKRKLEENDSTTPTVRLHVKRSRQERDDEPVKKQELSMTTLSPSFRKARTSTMTVSRGREKRTLRIASLQSGLRHSRRAVRTLSTKRILSVWMNSSGP